VDMPRSSYSYKKKLKPDEEDIHNKLKELAEAKPKYGYRMLHVLLRRKGYAINHKRTERIYAEERLSLRKKRKRRKTGSMYRTEVPKSERRNHIFKVSYF